MPKADPEVARAEFERMADAADVNISPDGLSEEEAEELAQTVQAFTRAIENGDMAIDEEGRAVLNVAEGPPIVFRVPLGSDLMIMASSAENKRMEAMGRFVSALTSQSTLRIGKLRKKEWKLAMRIAGFLSAD